MPKKQPDDKNQPPATSGGYVTTERTSPTEVTLTVVTPDGVRSHRIPGGITRDELLD